MILHLTQQSTIRTKGLFDWNSVFWLIFLPRNQQQPCSQDELMFDLIILHREKRTAVHKRYCTQASVNMNETSLGSMHTPRPLVCEPPIQYCSSVEAIVAPTRCEEAFLRFRCRVRAPSLVDCAWMGQCLHPRSLAVCDWEGTACVIAQDVVSNDVHVRSWSRTSRLENSREAERALWSCGHSRFFLNILRGSRAGDPGLDGDLDLCCNSGLCCGLHFFSFFLFIGQLRKTGSTSSALPAATSRDPHSPDSTDPMISAFSNLTFTSSRSSTVRTRTRSQNQLNAAQEQHKS